MDFADDVIDTGLSIFRCRLVAGDWGVRIWSQGLGVKIWSQGLGGLDFEELGLRGFGVSVGARWLCTLIQVKGLMM